MTQPRYCSGRCPGRVSATPAAQRSQAAPGRKSLVATVFRSQNGRHLALAGHLDTKPVGDAGARWRTDPFELTVLNGQAYGLGSSDMKGAVAAMMLAARNFAATPGEGALTLVLSADEEQGSAYGVRYLARQHANILAGVDGVVVGEPGGIERSWEGIYTVSRGLCAFYLEIVTQQGHSGLSQKLGLSAVQIAARIALAFEEFEPLLDDGSPGTGATTNPGITIEGGVGWGVWPGRASLAIEIRTVPGMSLERIHRSALELARSVAGGNAQVELRPAAGVQSWIPAARISDNSALVLAARRAAREVLGRTLPLEQYPGGTDAAYFTTELRIPSVSSLGPGLLTCAHGPNEYVPVVDLSVATKSYSELADKYTNIGCGGSDANER